MYFINNFNEWCQCHWYVPIIISLIFHHFIIHNSFLLSLFPFRLHFPIIMFPLLPIPSCILHVPSVGSSSSLSFGKSFAELTQELLQELLIGLGALYLKEEEPGGFFPMQSGDFMFHWPLSWKLHLQFYKSLSLIETKDFNFTDHIPFDKPIHKGERWNLRNSHWNGTQLNAKACIQVLGHHM